MISAGATRPVEGLSRSVDEADRGEIGSAGGVGEAAVGGPELGAIGFSGRIASCVEDIRLVELLRELVSAGEERVVEGDDGYLEVANLKEGFVSLQVGDLLLID